MTVSTCVDVDDNVTFEASFPAALAEAFRDGMMAESFPQLPPSVWFWDAVMLCREAAAKLHLQCELLRALWE